MNSYSEMGEEMKMTMKDIAKLANVSQATVSRVINGNPNVNKEAAKRVFKIIEEVGFKPNRTAQTLKNNASFLTGVSVIDISNPYFMDLIEALEYESRQHGYNIIIHNSNHNVLTEWDNIQNFMARQVDGILLVPTTSHNLSALKKLEVPTVIITQIKDEFDSVAVSHKQGVKLVAEHLISQGHHKLGYIGPMHDERLLFFKEAIFNNGLCLRDENIIELGSDSNSQYSIRQDIIKYLDTHEKLDFTAVFGFNDVGAFEFMKLMNERQIKVPEDIAVVGFDDTILSKSLSISSVHQPIRDMMQMAFSILQKRIKGEIEETPIKIELEPSLIIRNSSK
ncbi:LacI family DNA-binding transcriptional regulator [Cellulosilyticum sp. I15G10I2]|uniref:LacI family DNA-binding transcriptional regulator n=1 Tax=Cellulosilyticum sp. I15G10I2 TaxID=1892843 RepID=UPI001A9A4271|nr:LacI family DNA-binding transcriptional regulator [Cellulosilyticum sp. I15G10I2]